MVKSNNKLMSNLISSNKNFLKFGNSTSVFSMSIEKLREEIRMIQSKDIINISNYPHLKSHFFGRLKSCKVSPYKKKFFVFLKNQTFFKKQFLFLKNLNSLFDIDVDVDYSVNLDNNDNVVIGDLNLLMLNNFRELLPSATIPFSFYIKYGS